jgi:hypothetical protein
MSWGVIFFEFNREASLFIAIVCPVLILLPNFRDMMYIINTHNTATHAKSSL